MIIIVLIIMPAVCVWRQLFRWLSVGIVLIEQRHC